jgi:tetratricopeptide (TPR) repeat protein
MWRTHQKIRYSGVVHESIPVSNFEDAWPTRHMVTTDVFFWHDGYATDLSLKTARNIHMLRQELESTPGRIEAEAMLATTLQSNSDPEGLQRLCNLTDKLLEEGRDKPGPQVALAVAMYMDAMPPTEVKSEKTARLIERALIWYPKNPAILYYAAILEKERGNLQAALNYLLKLEARAELGDYDRSMSIPQEFLGEKLWNALGFIATQLGRRDVVQRCNRHMLMLRSPRR